MKGGDHGRIIWPIASRPMLNYLHYVSITFHRLNHRRFPSFNDVVFIPPVSRRYSVFLSLSLSLSFSPARFSFARAHACSVLHRIAGESRSIAAAEIRWQNCLTKEKKIEYRQGNTRFRCFRRLSNVRRWTPVVWKLVKYACAETISKCKTRSRLNLSSSLLSFFSSIISVDN